MMKYTSFNIVWLKEIKIPCQSHICVQSFRYIHDGFLSYFLYGFREHGVYMKPPCVHDFNCKKRHCAMTRPRTDSTD